MAFLPNEDEFDLTGELLPCEFCDELFPIDIFMEHSTGCGNLQMQKIAGQNEDNFEDAQPHFQKEPGMLSPAASRETIQKKKDNFGQVLSRLQDESEIISPAASKNTNVKVPFSNRAHSSVKLNVGHDEFYTGVEKSENQSILFDRAHNPKPMTYKKLSPEVPALSKLDNFDVSDMGKDDNVDLKDLVLSDDEDDAVESIETFWKRAADVLKQRLPTKDMVSNRYQNDTRSSAKNDNIINRGRHDWVW